MKPAFTIIELAVVITIVLLMLSLAGPAIRSSLLSNQQAKAVETFSILLTATQATARSHFTTAAMRIERAFDLDDQGQMVKDALGNPQWGSHQQVRLLVFANRRGGFEIPGEEWSFRQIAGTGVTALPGMVWLAPGYALSPGFQVALQGEPGHLGAAPISALDTFYVVFNRRGELVRWPSNSIVYLDETQGSIFVRHPHPSASSAVAYDRNGFEQNKQGLDFLKAGYPFCINRHTGSVIRAPNALFDSGFTP